MGQHCAKTEQHRTFDTMIFFNYYFLFDASIIIFWPQQRTENIYKV